MKTKKAGKGGRPAGTGRMASTLKQLYQDTTGDTAAHQRAIHGRLLHQPPRRQRIVQARIAGETLRQIANRENISHGAAADSIKKTMEAIRKDIAGEPRYNHQERKGAAPELPAPDGTAKLPA